MQVNVKKERAARGAGAYLTASLLTLAVAGLSSPAQAQNADANSAGAAPAEDTSDIIVTARHRGENLQNVPLSVTAFGGAELERQGMSTLKDLSASVPGMQFNDRGTLQTEITIRGVGGDARNPGIDTGVGMYVDGVYIARTSGYNADLSDIEQVEVLRGPQGTLFGKNTIGGVISVTTRKPSDKAEGFVSASYGNYNAIRTQATVSVPLTSNLFAKVTTATWDRDGYLHNIYDGQDYNNEDRRAGRVQLRWLPSDSLEINASADVTRDRTRNTLDQVGSARGTAAPYFIDDRFVINANDRMSNDRDMWGASINADYTFENGTVLSSITGYRKVDISLYSDADMLPIFISHSGPFTDDSEMVSQEIRLVSPSEKRFRYVGGLYYFHNDIRSDRTQYFPNLPVITSSGEAITQSYAGYLNLEYDLLPRFTINGGVRYTREDKNGTFVQNRPPLLNYDFPDLQKRDRNVSWMGSARYEFGSNATAYVTVSRGFKSGGFNLDLAGVANLTAQDLTFRPEQVTNYEFGFKGKAFDNRLRGSFAIFNMEYKDKQVAQFISSPLSPVPTVRVTNAGSARIRGFELEWSFKATPAFTLSSSLAYLDAKYTKFDAAAIVGGLPVSFAGNRVERTPQWTASGTAEYRQPVGHGNVIASATVNYVGQMYLQPDGSRFTYDPGHTLLSARLGYETKNGLSFYLWGKNLTQAPYITFARVVVGIDQVVYGEPRTYGVEARYRF